MLHRVIALVEQRAHELEDVGIPVCSFSNQIQDFSLVVVSKNDHFAKSPAAVRHVATLLLQHGSPFDWDGPSVFKKQIADKGVGLHRENLIVKTELLIDAIAVVLALELLRQYLNGQRHPRLIRKCEPSDAYSGSLYQQVIVRRAESAPMLLDVVDHVDCADRKLSLQL